MTDPPTKDFLRSPHSPFRYEKKQKPVSTTATPRLSEYDIPVSQPLRQSPPELSQPVRHTADPACLSEYDISRVTTHPSVAGPKQGVADAPLPDWRRNSKTAVERLNVPDDDLSIPTFLRRTIN
jgi:hypothetical protein